MITETRNKIGRHIGIIALMISTPSMAQQKTNPSKDDCNYEWLEEIEGEKPLNWVNAQNERTKERLATGDGYKKAYDDALKILNASDRIALPSRLDSQRMINFWQDEKNVRGILRQTTLEKYLSADPQWEEVLSIDALAKAEGENWVYKGFTCLAPDYAVCLLQLSRGGTDASVYREFDLGSRTFVKDGFVVPSAKTYVSWVDKDTLALSTDFGEGTMTSSGYPRSIRLWKRGQAMSDATELYSVPKESMSVSSTQFVFDRGTQTIIEHRPTFFENEVFLLEQNNKLRKIAIPLDAEIVEGIGDSLLIKLRSDWKTAGKEFKAGSVVAMPLNDVDASQVELVYLPSPTQSINQIAATKNTLLIGLLDSVSAKLLKLQKNANGWSKEEVKTPDHSALSLLGTTNKDDRYFYLTESFSTPPQLFFADELPRENSLVRTMPHRYNDAAFVTEQKFATSKDGTKIPYYIVHHADYKLDGKNPTLLYGYGGFEISLTPSYLSIQGKLWLEQGGVYVVANIRGGGEFGPQWHQAALKENRQLAYDDFIAVAEDLIQSKVTSSQHLGIMGGSNGGLLVGAVMTQRPDLFKAVVCLVPLLDMIRYTKLLAGASWAGEYGDPEDPKMREVILRYSPFQNVRPGVNYPSVFFYTSTKDDRVHPGHARKMAAKLLDLNQPVTYYENTEGGHAGSSNNTQLAVRQALVVQFLRQQLMAK